MRIVAYVSLRRRLMERLWADAETAYRAQILAGLAPDPSVRLLDVGCDDGAWTEEVRERLGVPARNVAGMEIVADRTARARERGFDVRVGDLDEPWPFDDASFDLVHANQVIEHVKRLDHFVEEIRRVLVPRGVVIVWTENLASWHNIAALAVGYQPFSATNISNQGAIGNPFALHAGEPAVAEPSQHTHVMALRTLCDLFVAHGFTIARVSGAGYHPFSGGIASRLAALDTRHAHFVGIRAVPAD